MRMMRNSGLFVTGVLLTFALALPLNAQDKNQVTRPFKGSSVMTVTYTPISPTTAIFHNEEEGVATFTGRYHNVGDGTTDFINGTTMVASGTITAANGDTAYWVLDPVQGFLVTGGTGRFEGASGHLIWTVVSQSDPVFYPDGTFVVTMVAEYDGEVTF